MAYWKDVFKESLNPIGLIFSLLGIIVPYYMLRSLLPEHHVLLGATIVIANFVGYIEGRWRKDRNKYECDDDDDDDCHHCPDRPSV